MLNREEAERIAAAVNALRPDWGQAGVLSILADDRIRTRRSYRDAALAFTALATDPTSVRPTRILEHGPWWEVARPITGAVVREIPPDGCAVCGQPEHVHDHVATYGDHKYLAPLDRARQVAERTARLAAERDRAEETPA